MSRADEEFLREAIRLARRHMLRGDGGPYGAVVVRRGRVTARGWNRVTSADDPTAHAEVEAIRKACRRLRTWRLTGATLYASCEPCPMCLGAVLWARIPRLVFASTRMDAARAGFDDAAFHRVVMRMRDRIGRRPEFRRDRVSKRPSVPGAPDGAAHGAIRLATQKLRWRFQPLEEARELFRLWRKMPDRVRY